MDSLGVAREFVGDLLQGPPPVRDMQDLPAAAEVLTQYVHRRIDALLSGDSKGEVGLLLSGGVDSLSLLAALAQHVESSRITAVTVVADNAARIDLHPAQEAARLFDINHRVVVVDADRLVALSTDALERLNIDELWEVAAAITVLAAYSELVASGFGPEQPVLTGGGADVLLAGGRVPPNGDYSNSEEWLTDTIFANVKSSFIENRLVPDFYERILGPLADTYVEFYQTMAAWEATNRFGMNSLFVQKESEMYDKACLRLAATSWGLPESLAWTRKSPMQISSGIIAGLAQISRDQVRKFPHATEYSDPMTEPADNVLARIALHGLGGND